MGPALGNPLVRVQEAQLGRRGSKCVAAATGASADLTGGSEAGMAPQSCPELGQKSLYLCSLHQPALE